MTNKKIGVISLGCDKNRVDTEYMLGVILGSEYRLTANIDEAQILVVNTCAFLEASRKEAIDTILDCDKRRANGVEKIVVTGCLSQKFINEIFDDLTEVDVFLGTKDYDLLPEALKLAYSGSRVNLVGKSNALAGAKRVLSTPKSYAYLKIAEGCDNKCTYCLIPKIRGGYVSEDIQKLTAEAQSLGEIQELILVAQDITRYGSDIGGGQTLISLLQRLSKLENIKSIRLLYCYPDLIGDALINEIKNNTKIVKYLDMPLQHSEDRILKLMNRKGSRQGYLSLINKLKTQIPGIALRSTFITGFPGETQTEFEGMLDFLRQAQLFNAGFFAYSREEDTPAYHLDKQVDEREKQKRIEKLYKHQTEIMRGILNEYTGRELEVLCDAVNDGVCTARAYFSAPDIDTYVYFEKENAQPGMRYRVLIEELRGVDLYGKAKD